MSSTSPDAVIVWGNCQAEPLSRLLAAPLAARGLRVVDVPPVFLVDDDGVRMVHELMAATAVLITQPVRDEYRVAGCGWRQLARLLPPTSRVLTFPVVFHTGLFPFQVNAHGANGERVDAPITIYHDLRTMVAAERGLTVEQTVRWWPAVSVTAARAVTEQSLTELRRREQDLDIEASDLVHGPHSLFTIDHPTNEVLGELARRVLGAVDGGAGGDVDFPAEVGVVTGAAGGDPNGVVVPTREFLGARRAPVEPGVSQAFGWPRAGEAPDWIEDGRRVGLATIVAAHLELYAARPDLVADGRARNAARLQILGL